MDCSSCGLPKWQCLIEIQTGHYRDNTCMAVKQEKYASDNNSYSGKSLTWPLAI